MASFNLNSRALRLLNSSLNKDALSDNTAPAEAVQANQTAWVGRGGALLLYFGALYWCFDSASQKRSFMGKTSEGRSKRLDINFKSWGKGRGVTRWLEWRRMFIRSNLFQRERKIEQKIYRYPSYCGALQKERYEAVELCCPLLGNGKKTRWPWIGLLQTASLAVFHAEFIKTHWLCYLDKRTQQYDGFHYFTSRCQIQRALPRFSGSRVNSAKGALWPKFFSLINTLTTKELLTSSEEREVGV